MKRFLVLIAALFWSSFALAQGINNPCGNPATTTVAGCVTYGTTAGTATQGNDSRITSITANGTAAVGQLPGTTTNDAAAAGKVGEYVSQTVAAPGVTLTANVAVNVGTGISLTAGDWDVSATCFFNGAASTAVNYLICSISQTTGTLDLTVGSAAEAGLTGIAIYTSGTPTTLSVPNLRISLSGTTTIYSVVQAGFGVSTTNVYGIISARRVR